ncbi:heterokaryon incompatibility protein-domain-containing protein [Daldinia vernicosa]|uniref:heterokaryon incompatibility protein-domain-containing protein n=1 Tax=Daldinia vernicosa TaxID=114800 RepID=UPI0020086F41|nr:heterokaryon incompatibility protein-domain-containing protein [Daldinia vernicosa]KAI0851665.1 heterokaryon incompatibility protein-domain-containing protein [Daldinia vernicosa]
MGIGLQKFILLPSGTPVSSNSSPDSPYEHFLGQVVVDPGGESDNESDADSIQLDRLECDPDEFKIVTPPAGDVPLCEFCSKDLIIDDSLFECETVVDSTGEERAALDLSSFRPKQWHDSLRGSLYEKGRKEGDASGWIHSGSQAHENSMEGHYREFCAGGDNPRIVTPPALPELSGPSAKECQFCARLEELFRKEYGERPWWNSPDSVIRFYVQYEWVQRRTTISERRPENEEPSEIRIRGKLDCMVVIAQPPDLDQDHANVFKFDVEAWPGTSRDWLHIRKSPLDPSGAVSDMNIHFIKRCIDKCAKDHKGCRDKLSDSHYVPTRLLDVGRSDGMARLVEKSQIPLDGSQLKYATLSYCWGSGLTLKTTKETKDEHSKVGIVVHSMPQTFQDAIEVVRKLGIRYLWIDALCIIQDIPEDWEAESVKMCDIFANSYITVSAAISTSSSESFLQRPQRNLLNLPFRSSLIPDVCGIYSIQLDGRNGSPKNIDLSHTMWHSRAWVWQEQIMSTRQLIFAEKGFQFRCNNGIRLERGPTTNDPEMSLNGGSNNINYWKVLLKEFTNRNISFPKDRLAAVSGVAKYIQNFQEEAGSSMKYLGGLWLDSEFEKFCAHLLWVCEKPAPSYKHMSACLLNEEQYCAPSWSWASRDKGVDFRWKSRPAFQVMRHDLQPACSDAMVRVKYGSSIVLRGLVGQPPAIPNSGRFNDTAGRWSSRWDAVTPDGTLYFWLDWMPSKEDPQEIDRQSNLELFLTSIEPNLDADGKRSAYGLLLLKFEDGHYRRVGMFQHHGDIEWFESLPYCDVKIH